MSNLHHNLDLTIIRGCAVNEKRLNQLGEVIRVVKRAENALDTKQVLSVIEKYNTALDMLDDYDHQTMKKQQIFCTLL